MAARSVALRNLASGESSPSSVIRNRASPFAPRDFACSVGWSGVARDAPAPPGTRSAFTVDAENASDLGRSKDVREVPEQHREPQVRLVGAVAVRRL